MHTETGGDPERLLAEARAAGEPALGGLLQRSMRSETRDRIIRAALAGDIPQAGIWIAGFVTARLMYAGNDRDAFLRAIEAVSDELLGIGLAVAEGAQPTKAEG
jgi:hypothetical protein